MTLKLHGDNSVWLDLAKDYRMQPISSAIEDLVESDELELLVPQVVLDEFARNKERVAVDATRSLQSHFKLVREAVSRFGGEAEKAATIKALNEVDHAAIIKGEAVNESINRIEKLLTSVPPLPTTDAIKARVTDRAIASRAPYHRSKSSACYAIMIETYSDQVGADQSADTRLVFVTHNVRDFSEPNGDQRKPHPDLLPLFDGANSVYSASLIDVLKEIDEDLLADHELELNGFFQTRRLSELLEADHLLFRQVWHNRHWNFRIEIEQGEHHVVSEDNYSTNPYRADQTLDTIWKGALEAAKRPEDEIPLENLGPGRISNGAC